MKKMHLIAAALFAFALMSLSGCGTDAVQASAGQTEVISVAVLLGNHGCSRNLNLSSPSVMNTISDAVGSGGFVSVICVDGDPDLAAAGNYAVDARFQGADPQLLARDVQKKTINLLSLLTEVKADSPEVDTLEAIQLAARTLFDAPAQSEKIILILDTGLSTTGLLDFGNNLLSADPDAIADMLDEREAIPDLSGIHVVWQQLGDVASPQEELSPAQRKRLEEIWSAIFSRSGASCEFLPTVANNEDLGDGLPVVTPVDLPREVPIAFDPITEQMDFHVPMLLDETQVQFVGDTAEYLYPQSAEETLRPIADYLLSHSDVSLLLVGTTAGDSDSTYTMQLSADRANAVRNTFVSFGVAPDRLQIKGMGCSDPWHIPGVGTESTLASQNRKVVLVDANTVIARELLAE